MQQNSCKTVTTSQDQIKVTRRHIIDTSAAAATATTITTTPNITTTIKSTIHCIIYFVFVSCHV